MIPTHGDQENSVWNGHYACTCYHPLFVFNQFGDLERCTLRPGNVHSADDWENVFKPVVVRYRGKVSRIYFRADAAFAMPAVYEFLEAERIKYVIRLPANPVLEGRIGYLLKRPVGRPPNEVQRFYANFTYQAGSWIKPRRVIAQYRCFRVHFSLLVRPCLDGFAKTDCMDRTVTRPTGQALLGSQASARQNLTARRGRLTSPGKDTGRSEGGSSRTGTPCGASLPSGQSV